MKGLLQFTRRHFVNHQPVREKFQQNLSCTLFFQLTCIFTIQTFYLNSFTSSSKLFLMPFLCTELPQCFFGYFTSLIWENEVNKQPFYREPYGYSLFLSDRFKWIANTQQRSVSLSKSHDHFISQLMSSSHLPAAHDATSIFFCENNSFQCFIWSDSDRATTTLPYEQIKKVVTGDISPYITQRHLSIPH